MAQHQARLKLDRVDPVWERIRHEAEAVTRTEPELATFIYSSILHHDALETAVVHRIAQRLDRADVSGELIRQAYADALEDDPTIAQAFREDIVATVDRDPATHRYLEPVLYFKGFHAIQTYRLAHWLWQRNRKDLAYYLQSRSSAAFQTDIHPAARIGRGIFLDHATGLVVGETAVIEDDVSMLHGVTLGGTGKQDGDRHPKIRRGVMIGAGAKDRRRRARKGHRRSRLPGAGPFHGPDFRRSVSGIGRLRGDIGGRSGNPQDRSVPQAPVRQRSHPGGAAAEEGGVRRGLRRRGVHRRPVRGRRVPGALVQFSDGDPRRGSGVAKNSVEWARTRVARFCPPFCLAAIQVGTAPQILSLPCVESSGRGLRPPESTASLCADFRNSTDASSRSGDRFQRRAAANRPASRAET